MGLRLLIVEDDIPLQQMLTWDFEELGYTVTAAASCQQALEAITRKDFDLALVDYHLPDGTGVDLLADLRSSYPNMPVIMSSGLACAETASKAVTDHGAFRFVPKPTAAETLHQVFQSALKSEQK